MALQTSCVALMALLATVVLACGDRGAVRPAPPAPATAAPIASVVVQSISLTDAGLDPDAIDDTVDPCDDLYRHACGRWVSGFAMPEDKVTYEKTYTRAADEMALRLRAILEETPPADAGEARRALYDFYSTCLDEKTLLARGLAPIEPYLERIRAAKTHAELAAAVGEVHPIIDALFSFGTEADQNRPPKVRAWLGSGGIRGISADVLMSAAAADQDLRAAFASRIRNHLVLGGMRSHEAEKVATSAMKVHIGLAQAMKEAWAIKGDRSAVLDVAALEKEAPGFPWKPFFDAAGLSHTGELRVADLPFLRGMATRYEKLRLDDLKGYVVARLVMDTSHALDERYREARWRDAVAEWGQHGLEPRWKVCVRAAATALRDPLTEAYLARHFSKETRASFRAMYERFASSFEERLGELDWLDGPTKAAARGKLRAMGPRIGGPEKLGGPLVPIASGRHGENVLGADLARARRGFAAAGGPFDEAQWRRNPLDTNAFVDNTSNSIVFPAAFLRPPMFDPRATIPVQYGAIGFHLGHEMIHNFDTNGARHDSAGRLANWWTPESWKAFQSKASCIRNRFLAEAPIAGRRIDAERTLTENIADFGGLRLAFRAYRDAREDAKTVTKAGRYTEDQQFFMSFAQDHCVVFGEVDLMRFVERNVHAPHWLRVNAAADNFFEFQRAFGCKPRENTCELW